MEPGEELTTEAVDVISDEVVESRLVTVAVRLSEFEVIEPE